MKSWLPWIGAVAVFGSLLMMVAQKEELRQKGQSVFLHLAPRDPRSLLQGDYMALNYQIARDITGQTLPETGCVVVKIDTDQIAHFIRLTDGHSLALDEHLLKYHVHDGRAQFGAESYFIPEGTGEKFTKAVYGELKIDQDGNALLVGLRDEKFQPLAAKP